MQEAWETAVYGSSYDERQLNVARGRPVHVVLQMLSSNHHAKSAHSNTTYAVLVRLFLLSPDSQIIP